MLVMTHLHARGDVPAWPLSTLTLIRLKFCAINFRYETIWTGVFFMSVNMTCVAEARFRGKSLTDVGEI